MATRRPRRGRRLRRGVGLGLVVGLLLTLTGCRFHADFTIQEDRAGMVTFRLLSGSGRYVVVQATGAGETVPSAGWWRVDREDWSADLLPFPTVRISADGARVLSAAGALWDDGSVVPGPGLYSDDLTYRVFLSEGTVTSQEVATGTTVEVEAGHPRPAGTTTATPISISDDGQTVRYRLGPADTIDRIVRLDHPTPLDLPAPARAGMTSVAYEVAAGGSALVRTIEEFTSVDTPFGTFEMMAGSTVDLLAVPSGAVVATRSVAYEPTDTRWTTLDRTLISEDGTRLWVNEKTAVMDVDTCGSATPTIPETCTIANQLTTIAGGRTRTFPLDGGDLTGFDITPDGLLAVTDRRAPIPVVAGGYAPEITHALHGDWETLTQGPTTTSSSGVTCFFLLGQAAPCTVPVVGAATQISDDGKVLSARSMTGAGWYDYVDGPDPPT